MTYDIRALMIYKRGNWIKGQFFLHGAFITFRHNIKTHETQYEGVADGKICEAWYLHGKYGLNKYDLEDSIEEYAVTWWAKQLKKREEMVV